MRPSTIWYTLKQGFKNIKRNWMFSLACIITMAACIFLVGIFYSIVNNVGNIAHKVEEEVPITVFFDEGTSEEEIQAIGDAIQSRAGSGQDGLSVRRSGMGRIQTEIFWR